MKKMVTSAGLLALGAVALHGLDPEMTRAKTGRPFTVAATVRGFYDDNPTTSPDKFPVGTGVNGHPEDSFGLEVSPSVHLNLPLEQTFLRVGYVYSLRYYEDRDPDNFDQSHEFNALLSHAFSPRHNVSVNENFSMSKEPTVTDRFGIITAPTRSEGDTIRNRASVDYALTLTELLSLGLGYGNSWYDYDQGGRGSRSALLDRLEHTIRVDGRYQVDPSMFGVLGYNFGVNNFIADQFIYTTPMTTPSGKIVNPDSSIRDNISHYGYVGAEKDFNNKLRASLRVGVQYSEYVHTDESAVNPYVDGSLSYVYLPECSLELGIRHARNATDVATASANGTPTLDQETTAGYLQLSHRITPDLTGSIFFQVQSSSFNAGGVDGEDEMFYMVGENIQYRVAQHWSVELGHNYDLLCSDLKRSSGGRNYEARSYDRNRVYIGVRASY